MEYRRLTIAGLNADEAYLFREGAPKFLQYTPEFTRKVEKSQADYEQAHAKCQVSLFSLPFLLHSSDLLVGDHSQPAQETRAGVRKATPKPRPLQ